MRPLTRRRALHGVAGLLGCLAGCSAENTGIGASGRESTRDPNGETVTDPAAASLRVTGERPVVWREGETADESDGRDRLSHEFLADAQAVRSLSFATDADGVDEVRSFLDSTDFDAETVYVEQTAVGECFRRELCAVRWTDTEIHTSYVRRFRDADVACETDAKDTVAWFVRIPDAVDPDAIDGYGSRYGSDGCRLPDGRRAGGRGADDAESSPDAGTDDGTGRDGANAEAER